MLTNYVSDEKTLKIDLGCGYCKKEGTIGIDICESPGVDHVLDIESEPLPFPDKSVEYVYSSHFLEHIEKHGEVFKEISRVSKNGALLEFWTPYAWTNAAFVFGHKFFFTEDPYLHICQWYPEIWQKELGARWILKEIIYVIKPEILVELHKQGVKLDFALRHYHNIASEFGVIIEVHHEHDQGEVSEQEPIKTFCFGRSLERYRYPLKVKQSKGLFYKFEISISLIREIGVVNFFHLLMNNWNKIQNKLKSKK